MFGRRSVCRSRERERAVLYGDVPHAFLTGGALTYSALTCGALTCGALTCGALTCGALAYGALTCGVPIQICKNLKRSLKRAGALEWFVS